MPEPEFVEGVRPVAPGAAPAPIGPPPAGALRKPDVLIPNVAWLPPAAKPKTTVGAMFRRFLRYLAAFLVLALIVAWMFAPAIARAWIVSGARARGVTVTIDRVDVSRKGIRLNDFHAEAAEFPGASLNAGTLMIGFRWLVPDAISLDDTELAFDGSYSATAARLEQFRAQHGITLAESLPGIRKIEVTSGRVSWKNMLGAGTSALVENITAEVAKNPIRAFGDDYHLTAPLFTMKLAGAPAGPWQLDVDRQGILVRTVLRFDPAGSSTAQITRTAGDDGSISVALAIPPTSLADLHIPAGVLGGVGTARTRVEAHGELNVVAVSQTTTRAGDASAPTAPSASAGPVGSAARGDGGALAPPAPPVVSRTASGRLLLAASGLAVFPSGPPVDVSLDLPVASGDPSAALPVVGLLSFAATDPAGGTNKAAATAPVSGTLDRSGPMTRLELSGKSSAIPCMKAAPPPGLAPAPPTPPAAAAKDGTTGIVATVAVTLDDLPGARVSFKPTAACAPRLR
jgi:hypothetical protein